MRLRVSKARWKSYTINALELIERTKFTDKTRVGSAPPQRGTKRGPNKAEKDEESDGTE
jgi:hypothetical protein